MDIVTLQAAKVDAKKRYSASTAGNKLRRAAVRAARRNAIELGVMSSPPTVTTGTANLDATVTKQYRISAGAASNFAFRGGVPTIVSSVYYRFPIVTLTTTGNAIGNLNALSWAAEFHSDSPKVMFRLLNSSGGGLRFEVDDQYVSTALTAYPSTIGTGYVLLDFTSAGGQKVRKFRFEAEQAGAFDGVYVMPTSSVWAPNVIEPTTVACVGDSVAAGTGKTSPNGNWLAVCGKLLGWTDTRQIAIGATGFTTFQSGGNVFGDAQRVADAVAANPDLLLIQASINDNSQSGIQAAALACFQAYRTALPKVPIVVGGVWASATGPNAATLANEASVLAAFNQWGDSNSWYVPVSNDSTGPWVFGLGRVGATTNGGNSDVYVGTDTVHPPDAGHEYLGRRWANALRSQVLPNIT